MSDELINKVKFQRRDCEHGRQVGKCETCDLFEAYDEIETLHTQLAEANERVRELELTVQKQSNLLEFYVNDYASKQLRKEQDSE